jgi:hypothetical protein
MIEKNIDSYEFGKLYVMRLCYNTYEPIMLQFSHTHHNFQEVLSDSIFRILSHREVILRLNSTFHFPIDIIVFNQGLLYLCCIYDITSFSSLIGITTTIMIIVSNLYHRSRERNQLFRRLDPIIVLMNTVLYFLTLYFKNILKISLRSIFYALLLSIFYLIGHGREKYKIRTITYTIFHTLFHTCCFMFVMSFIVE